MTEVLYECVFCGRESPLGGVVHGSLWGTWMCRDREMCKKTRKNLDGV